MTIEIQQDDSASGTPPSAAGNSPISDYYDDTLIDYDVWSKEGYLHFGYWRPWMNPFRRQPMLEEMNRLIFHHLRLDAMDSGEVADLGCGVGAVARFGSEQFPQLRFHAVSISAGQIAEAQARHCNQRVEYYCGDYHDLPFSAGQLDGIFYLESLCHSVQPEKALAEAARTLKPGGRIVLTDGFLTRPLESTSSPFRYVVQSVAHNWAVPMFHEISRARSWDGNGRLRLVEEFECGWRLGPSALHAAHLSLMHYLRMLAKPGATAWQRRHLTASAFTIALGLYRRYFRYHLLAFERF